MGFDIKTDNHNIVVYTKDKNTKNGTIRTYFTKLSKKNTNNEWESCFFDLRFPKDTVLENKTEISIQSAFQSFSTYNGKSYPFIYVKEFKIEKAGETTNNNDNADAGFMNVPDDYGDLPFAQPMR